MATGSKQIPKRMQILRYLEQFSLYQLCLRAAMPSGMRSVGNTGPHPGRQGAPRVRGAKAAGHMVHNNVDTNSWFSLKKRLKAVQWLYLRNNILS